MIIVNIVILFIYILMYIATKNYRKDEISSIDKKDNSLKFIYGNAMYILDAVLKKKDITKINGIDERIKSVNIVSNSTNTVYIYFVKKISLIIMLIFIFNTISLFTAIAANVNYPIKSGRYIVRPSHGEGEMNYNINVDNGEIQTEIEVVVGEQRYTYEQITDIFDKIYEPVVNNMLEENEDLENISSNLEFDDYVDEYGIDVIYEPENIRIIDNNGNIDFDKIDDELLTYVDVTFKYYEYEAFNRVYMKLVKPEKTKTQLFLDKINMLLTDADSRTNTDDKYELVTELDGKEIRYSTDRDNTYIIVFILGIIVSCIMYFAPDMELYKKLEKRNNEMMIDYAEIISKLTLLLGAGMTIKAAWKKIALDYKLKINNSNARRRYAYEEMLITYHEIDSGISEVKAYERFGQRCRIHAYLKFSTLLVQNIKKGSKGLLDSLMEESTEAFEERKVIARRLGEEAGTKLLLPMFIMLGVAIVIIIVPAFMSFNL